MAGRVEPGVTGKEKLFQQSREFGPGAMKPYTGVTTPLAQRRFYNRHSSRNMSGNAPHKVSGQLSGGRFYNESGQARRTTV